MQRLLTNRVRQILFTMIPFIFLGWQSIYFLIENRPEEFTKFGAIIIIWSLINISLSRNRYASSISKWEQSMLWTHIEYYRGREELKDESLHLTFNLHACQIAQMSAHLGLPNPFVNRLNTTSGTIHSETRR
jgi:hypothetical protein